MSNLTPKPYRNQLLRLPIAIVIINVAIWLWSIASGVHWHNPTPLALQQWGGNLSLLTMIGQAWRLLTAMFMHSGFMHLFVNMFFLIQIAPLLVQRIGAVGFAIVYVCGGLLASISSTAWQTYSLLSSLASGSPPQLIVSVGASGAVMAVAGALTWEVIASQKGWGQRHHIVFHNNQALKSALLRTIGLNVMLGFMIAGIDQAAHIGGLIAGAYIAARLPAPSTANPKNKRARTTLAALEAFGVLFMAYLCIRSIYGAQLEALLEHLQR